MASGRAAGRGASAFIDPPGYARHRPEETLPYRLVEQHYSAFLAARETAGRPLPRYVQAEFEAYRKCGLLEHGFLRVRCEDCHAEKLVAFSCKRRGHATVDHMSLEQGTCLGPYEVTGFLGRHQSRPIMSQLRVP